MALALLRMMLGMKGPQILEGNRAVLGRRFPALLARLSKSAPTIGFECRTNDAGHAVAYVTGVPLQNPQHPLEEARRWARDAVEKLEAVSARRAVVVGLALGYHVEALLERFDGRITVVEPDAELLRGALASRDLSQILERVDVVGPGESPEPTPETSRVLAYAPLLLVPGAPHHAVTEECQRLAAKSAPRLRVLVVSPMYGGSHPMAGYAARALGRLGHDTELLDLAEYFDGFRSLGRFTSSDRRRRRVESLYCDTLGDAVAARVEETGADLVLALAQAPLGEAALRAIERAGAMRALWFVEDFRLFTYWKSVAPFYDYIFTIQRDECLEAIADAGCGQVSYLPCAFDPDVHRPLDLDRPDQMAYGSDVSFVGAGYRNRRDALRRFLDMDFRLWGSDWDEPGELRRHLERKGARITPEESVRIWNASKVNLNLHSSTYCDGVDPRGDFVNPRTFELAGAGAFQIVDERSLLPELFDTDELVAVRSVDEMREATLHFLDRPEERAAIAARARERALRDHTYERRMEDLISTVVARDQDRLAAKDRAWTVRDAKENANGALSTYLSRFPEKTPFTIDEMIRTIPDRRGALEDPEAIFLFLHQFDELYLTEHRQ